MQFQVIFTASSDLKIDANIPNKRRKQLEENLISPWELRIDKYRVFYAIETDSRVKIIAIGYKEHNDLFIRSQKVEL
jgi:mRNA-degrading endonuclease RelE of RelBE toxin-antitoxin system